VFFFFLYFPLIFPQKLNEIFKYFGQKNELTSQKHPKCVSKNWRITSI